ncbi:hypothetical protein [Ahrensia sp. R2A130]|uniref:hypothetical protein n=1 Tax=Ahrensia sp. R2A130 TaxID=744979 RepID=UPI00031A6C6F|nr:hypothetical protein [Ahrensia sp. R2A130]
MLRHFLIFVALCFVPSLASGETIYAEGAVDLTNGRPIYRLVLSGKLVTDGPVLKDGMVWRVYRDRRGGDGEALPLIATATGGTGTFDLNAGTYFIHAAFGRAGAGKRVVLSGESSTEELVLEAGGLQLAASAAGKPIPSEKLRFSIYEREADESGERQLIALNVAGDKIIRLKAGTYHVLSRYGTINATVRADLQVKAGELTKAELQHRGSPISLRAVSEAGGVAVANTAWTVFTADGEQVFASSSIAPSLVLAEGEYEAAVRYGAEEFRQPFTVGTGEEKRIEILLN